MTNHEYTNSFPVESDDDALLKMLAGANFGPNTKIVLPSGTEISGDEAQVFTSLHDEGNTQTDRKPDAHDDAAAVRMLSGAHFGPDSHLVLPTGKKITGEEAQSLIDARNVDDPYEDISLLDPLYDQWTGDYEIDRAHLVARALAQNDRVANRAANKSKKRFSNLFRRNK